MFKLLNKIVSGILNTLFPKKIVQSIVSPLFKWLKRHPIQVDDILDLIEAIEKSDFSNVSAQLVGYCSDKDTVRIKLDSGQVIEIPSEYLGTKDSKPVKSHGCKCKAKSRTGE